MDAHEAPTSDLPALAFVGEQRTRDALAYLLFARTAEAAYLFAPATKRLVDANPAFLRLTGYAPADVPRLTLYNLAAHPPADVDALVARGLAADGAVVNHERTWRRADGTTLPVRVTGGATCCGGRTLGFVIARDLTAERRMAAALRRERDFVAASLDTTGSLTVVLDRAGRIVRFNSACERLTGYHFAEVRNRSCWEMLLPADELAQALQVFVDLCAGHSPAAHEHHWLTKRGERRLIAWSNSALRDEAGVVEHVVATGIDITDRVRCEAALHRHQAGLSPQEREVLPWLAREDQPSYRQIGAHFGVKGDTIRKHMQGIARKLCVKAERKIVADIARVRGLV